MGAKIEKILWIDPDEGSKPYRLGIKGEKQDGCLTLEIGCYWRDKPYPSHSFTVTADDLVGFIETLEE